MAEATVNPNRMANVALRSLHDISVPEPVSWMPQTWGWALVVVCILLVLAVYGFRAFRRYQRNAYRREALELLVEIAETIQVPATRQQGIDDLAELVKRTALAGWRREQVAPLTGANWNAFLASSADNDESVVLKRLFDDLEYHDGTPFQHLPSSELTQLVQDARHWIEGHHVSA
ncbi:DUF4381 domain-containing protein [Rhizobium sp. ZPR4]